MKRLLAPIIIGMLLLSGCGDFTPLVSPIVGICIKWIEGEAHAYFASDREATYRAVKRALANLDSPIISEHLQSSGDHHITAGHNDRFKIKVIEVEPYVTRVSIRINVMGDKPYAELIYKELINQLDVIEYDLAPKHPGRIRPRQ